ncbi:MAG: ABC transporter substrate-binding protein, partial [Bacteroidia bacterium]|nr:ABC transporter substrate-binding protein [Bacteroidia bacterium]
MSFVSLSASSLQGGPGAVIAKDPVVKKEFHIALMLPFCIDDPTNFKIRERMADYYEGVLLAMDELESKGMNLKLHVFDTRKDSMVVIGLLKNVEMIKMDLIIGPVFENELVEVEKFCAIYNIPLVSPLKYYSKKTAADYPLFNNVPADSMLFYYMGAMAAESFPRHQVIVLDDVTKNGKSNSNNFRKAYAIASKKEAKLVD